MCDPNKRKHVRGNSYDFAFLDIISDELKKCISVSSNILKCTPKTYLHFIRIAFDNDVVITNTDATVPQLLALLKQLSLRHYTSEKKTAHGHSRK